MDLSEIQQFKTEKDLQRHPWEKSRLAITIHFINKFLPGTPELSVLDIGCGDGYILEGVRDFFKKGTFIGVDNGFEKEFLAAKNNQSQGKKIFFYKYISDIPAEFLAGGLSFVLLMDVLEHIEKDEAFLLQLSKEVFITKKTFIFITVPSYQFLFTSHDLYLRHFRRYSLQQLSRRISGSGFTIINSGYFFISLLPFRLVNMIASKIANRQKNSGFSNLHWNNGKLLTTIVSEILLFDFMAGQLFNAFGIKIPGLSNYAICKKSAW